MNFDQSVQGLALKGQNKNTHRGKGKSSTSNNSLKVVYISSPMKVKTSASRFRSLVQELTGKDSDISRYMDDESNFAAGRDFIEEDFFGGIESTEKESNEELQKLSYSVSPDDSTLTSSDSFLGKPAMDGVFVSQMKEQFEEIFSANSFYDPSHMDVIGRFDELLY